MLVVWLRIGPCQTLLGRVSVAADFVDRPRKDFSNDQMIATLEDADHEAVLRCCKPQARQMLAEVFDSRQAYESSHGWAAWDRRDHCGITKRERRGIYVNHSARRSAGQHVRFPEARLPLHHEPLR